MAVAGSYDVIVAGLGAWGSATAWQLTCRGRRVLGFDRFAPPHNQGSHSGITRLARRSSHEGVEYAALTARAFELWEELAAEASKQLVVTTGALMLAPAGHVLLEVSAASLERIGVPYELLDRETAARRFPAYRLHEGEAALYEPGASVIMSADGIRAHLAAAARRGAEIHTAERLVRWTETAEGVLVETERASYAAERLVLTLGAWNPDLLGFDLPLRVERQVLVTFETGAGTADLPCFFAPCRVERGRDVGVYGAPEPAGGFKIALHHGGKTGHPDRLSRAATERDVERVRAEARERLPEVAEAPAAGKVCLYTNSPDGHWIVGVHPSASRVAFATGCSGRGYRYAPAIGEALADLVDGVPRPDLAFLSRDRFASAA